MKGATSDTVAVAEVVGALALDTDRPGGREDPTSTAATSIIGPTAAAAAAAAGDTRPSVAAVRDLLGETMCVKVSDGRIYEGRFHCFDNLGNIILASASQVFDDPSSTPPAAAADDDAEPPLPAAVAAAHGIVQTGSSAPVYEGADLRRPLHVGAVLIAEKHVVWVKAKTASNEEDDDLF